MSPMPMPMPMPMPSPVSSPTPQPSGRAWPGPEVSGAPSPGTPGEPGAEVPSERDLDIARFVDAVPRHLRRAVVRSPLTRESAPRSALAGSAGLFDDELVREVWDIAAAEGPLLARRHRALLPFWGGDLESAEPAPDGDLWAVTAACALRETIGVAEHAIRDARNAIDTFPRCHEILEAAQFPAPWFRRMLGRTRHLADRSRRGIDDVISAWDLRITAEAFRRRLSQLVTWAEQVEEREAEPPPVQRSVDVMPAGRGMSVLSVVGPAPEVHSLHRRLDVAARAVRTAQRAALESGGPIPLDPDGMVAETGRPLRLDTLRYLLLTRAEFDTEGVSIPADRFRITITVPVMTLLGASEAPGMLEGVTPIPADLARKIAGGENTWYRVLTDPSSGAYLPLAADRYRATPAQLEYLRLVSPQCAVPGFPRVVSWASQCDHIQEWDASNPDAGGQTQIDNLHLLCLHHHQQKTAGLLDPRREAREAGGIGRTRWLIGSPYGQCVEVDASDDRDIAGPLLVDALSTGGAPSPEGWSREPDPAPRATPWKRVEHPEPRADPSSMRCVAEHRERERGHRWGDQGPPPF